MPSDDRRDDWQVPAASALLVAGLAIVAHAEVLGLWFTGTDTIPLIESSRVQSMGGAAALLVEPLMAGTSFAETALFYRPVVSLSFALDHALWGLDPTGYHLTDLLLHAATTALVVLLVREVGEDVLAGVVAGLVFGLHPLTVEVIPAPARRQDVLAATFVVLSVLLFVHGLRRDRRLVLASAGAYLLALGSKETGIVLPALVGVWFLLVELREGVDVDVVRRGVAVGAPFVVATAAYFAARFAVLGGLGGYVGRSHSLPVDRIVERYAASLLYPVDHLSIGFGVDAPVVPDGLVALAGVCALLVVLTAARREPAVLASDRARRLAFFGFWPLPPLALALYAERFAFRSGYLSLVPVGAVVGLLVAPWLRRLVAGGGDGDVPGGAAALLAILLATSLLAGSPAVRSCDGWVHASDVTRGSLEAIDERSDELPREGTVVLAGHPELKSAEEVTDRPRARSVTYYSANSVSSWLRLRDPGREVTVRVENSTRITHRRVDVRARVTDRGGNTTVVLAYEPRADGGPCD